MPSKYFYKALSLKKSVSFLCLKTNPFAMIFSELITLPVNKSCARLPKIPFSKKAGTAGTKNGRFKNPANALEKSALVICDGAVALYTPMIL